MLHLKRVQAGSSGSGWSMFGESYEGPMEKGLNLGSWGALGRLRESLGSPCLWVPVHGLPLH